MTPHWQSSQKLSTHIPPTAWCVGPEPKWWVKESITNLTYVSKTNIDDPFILIWSMHHPFTSIRGMLDEHYAVLNNLFVHQSFQAGMEDPSSCCSWEQFSFWSQVMSDPWAGSILILVPPPLQPNDITPVKTGEKKYQVRVSTINISSCYLELNNRIPQKSSSTQFGQRTTQKNLRIEGLPVHPLQAIPAACQDQEGQGEETSHASP